MRRAIVSALALLAAVPAAASGGFIAGGIGLAQREVENGFEYDDGIVLALQAGTHYENGLMLRVDYDYAYYDTLTAANGAVVVASDIQQQEGRFGVFYATPRRAAVRFRWGGGYVYADEDTQSQDSRYQDGGFVEGGVAVDAGERVTFEAAAAGLKLDGPKDYDAEGAELRGGVALHFRRADLTLGARYAALDRDDTPDERRLELRLGVTAAWSYPEDRW